jgi:hypothetical protein
MTLDLDNMNYAAVIEGQDAGPFAVATFLSGTTAVRYCYEKQYHLWFRFSQNCDWQKYTGDLQCASLVLEEIEDMRLNP